MTPKRAFLLGALAVAFAVAALGSSWLVRDTQPVPEAETAHEDGAGDGHSHAGEDPKVIQFFKDPKPVKSFSVETLEGRVLRSGDLKGKVLILNFWATWCPPCRAEIPDLVALQAKYREQVVVLGISVDEVPAVDVRTFAERYKVNYPIAMATEAIHASFPGLGSLPMSLIVDRDGLVVQKHVGMLNAARTDAEVRVLAGLPADVTVERVDADKPVGPVREIPGVDLTRLPAARRGDALQALNAEACTCGCGLTVARCRVDDPSCSVSLPVAKRIVDDMVASAR